MNNSYKCPICNWLYYIDPQDGEERRAYYTNTAVHRICNTCDKKFIEHFKIIDVGLKTKSIADYTEAEWAVFNFKNKIRQEEARNLQNNLYKHEPEVISILDHKFNEAIAPCKSFMIDRVIFHEPATIIYWADGDKTVVKCSENDTFDPEKGFAMACTKKMFGNAGNYMYTVRKYVYEYYSKKNTEREIPNLMEFMKVMDFIKENL